jgi:hypothetical protein
MSINPLQQACDQAAAQLDALLDEACLEEYAHLGADVYGLIRLGQACLETAARLDDTTDAAISHGAAGLVQITTAALTGEPAAQGLELDAISQVVTTARAAERVES